MSKTEITNALDELLEQHIPIWRDYKQAVHVDHRNKEVVNHLSTLLKDHELGILYHVAILNDLIEECPEESSSKDHKLEWISRFDDIRRQLVIGETASGYMRQLIDTHAEKLGLRNIHCIKCGVEVLESCTGMTDSGTIDWNPTHHSGFAEGAKYGIVSDITAGFGSRHDLCTFRIAICDDCIEANEGGKSLYLRDNPLVDDAHLL